MSILGIHHIALLTGDLERALDYCAGQARFTAAGDEA
jgi:hypothetical protein